MQHAELLKNSDSPCKYSRLSFECRHGYRGRKVGADGCRARMYFVFINGFLELKKAEHRHNHELERRQNPQNEHAELLVDFYTMGGNEGSVVLYIIFLSIILFS